MANQVTSNDSARVPFTFEEKKLSKPFNAGHVNDIISPNRSVFS